jgi:putative lipoprotein
MSNQSVILKRLAPLPVMLVLLILAACGGTGATTGEADATPDANVTGTVTYLQRSALAPGSVVTVQIQDISRQDVAAEIIGEQVITTTDQQVPIPFSVPYSSSAIVENNTYALQARIESPEGQLLFINDTVTPVITRGAPTSDVEMVLVAVGGSSQTAPSDTSAMPDGAVTGTVSYMQRIALAPGSVVTVQLQDVSRMDAPAEILSEQVITVADEQQPFAYQLPYSNSQFDEGARLVVRATIDDPEGNLIFTSDTVTPVITNGAPTENVEIVVVPAQ